MVRIPESMVRGCTSHVRERLLSCVQPQQSVSFLFEKFPEWKTPLTRTHDLVFSHYVSLVIYLQTGLKSRILSAVCAPTSNACTRSMHTQICRSLEASSSSS